MNMNGLISYSFLININKSYEIIEDLNIQIGIFKKFVTFQYICILIRKSKF
jgi:hypothetical protein